MWHHRVPHGALARLERHAGKLARAVLRGLSGSNPARLPGKLVEADNKTVALHSPGTVQAVQLIADMYQKHKIIPKGAIAWDNTGNNKAYQSRQVIFVQNSTSIYAHLAESDKELYNTTGLLPMPAGPAGAFATLGAFYWALFKHNPYPEVAKGLVEYWMAPE